MNLELRHYGQQKTFIKYLRFFNLYIRRSRGGWWSFTGRVVAPQNHHKPPSMLASRTACRFQTMWPNFVEKWWKFGRAFGSQHGLDFTVNTGFHRSRLCKYSLANGTLNYKLAITCARLLRSLYWYTEMFFFCQVCINLLKMIREQSYREGINNIMYFLLFERVFRAKSNHPTDVLKYQQKTIYIDFLEVSDIMKTLLIK